MPARWNFCAAMFEPSVFTAIFPYAFIAVFPIFGMALVTKWVLDDRKRSKKNNKMQPQRQQQ